MLLAEPDLDLNVDEALDELPPCEGPNHPFGNHGHVPDTFAEYWIIPACGHEWYACAGWTNRVLPLGGYLCDDGGHRHHTKILNVLPLK